MIPVLRNYSDSVIPTRFYKNPRILGYVDDISNTTLYTSPAIHATFLRVHPNTEYFHSPNANSSVYYIVSGTGKLNNATYNKGDVICINTFAHITAETYTTIYNVHDGPLMDYFKVKTQCRESYELHYTHERIMEAIDEVERNQTQNPNRLGVIFGTENTYTLSNTLWCLMTKTLPYAVQPAHKHNSVALDYCVKGKGYTLLSKERDAQGELVDPVRIDWKEGMVFLTPPGWWHSHHSTDSEPGYIFPVQDAGLHMHLDTLNIEFG